MILSAQRAAEEPETSTHGDSIDEDVLDDSMEADEAHPFKMIRFLKDAQADRAAQAAATEQLLDYPANWASMTKPAKKKWKQNRKPKNKTTNSD